MPNPTDLLDAPVSCFTASNVKTSLQDMPGCRGVPEKIKDIIENLALERPLSQQLEVCAKIASGANKERATEDCSQDLLINEDESLIYNFDNIGDACDEEDSVMTAYSCAKWKNTSCQASPERRMQVASFHHDIYASWYEIGPLEGVGAPRQTMSYPGSFGDPCGIPTENISQTAALPQSSAPIEAPEAPALPAPAALPGQAVLPPQVADRGIQGARNPSSALKGIIPPHKQKLIQQHLILLLHAYKCIRVEVLKIPCPVPYCDVMKAVQKHLKLCQQGDACPAPFCSSSRRIITHWKRCRAIDCVVCGRLKNVARKVKRKRQEKGGSAHCNMAQSGHPQPMAVPHMGMALAFRSKPIQVAAAMDKL